MARGSYHPLHAAIRLWFDEQNVALVHTLAIAAQSVLNVACRKKGLQTSRVLAEAERHPRRRQDMLRSPQNFFKHGYHKQPFKGVVSHVPQYTEIVILDCLAMYERLFGDVTPLMNAFGLWQSLKNPEISR